MAEATEILISKMNMPKIDRTQDKNNLTIKYEFNNIAPLRTIELGEGVMCVNIREKEGFGFLNINFIS